MPNEVFDIRLFNKGIASNFDLTDTPLEAAQWSENVDSQAEGGVLRGVKTDQVVASPFVITNGAVLDKTIDDTLKKVLVYTDGTTVKANDFILNGGNIPNTLTTQSLTTSNASSFTPQNDICYIGTGNNTTAWAGYYKDGLQFNGQINWNSVGVNDLSIDIIEASILATKTFKVKILRAGYYGISLGNSSELGWYYSATLPLLNEVVYINIDWNITESDPNLPSGSATTTFQDTVTYVDTAEGYFITSLGAQYVSTGFTTYTGSGVYHYKHPDTVTPIDMYHWTNDGSDPIYTLANKKWLAEKEYITLSDNVKIYFNKKTGHTKDSLWTITVNPISTLFNIVSDDASKTPNLLNTIFFVSALVDNGFVWGGTFQIDTVLIYGFSLIYDYISETPIYTNSTYVFNPTLANSRHNKGIRVVKANLSSRVTGINVYLGQNTVGNLLPSGYFRLLKSFEIAPNKDFTETNEFPGSVRYDLMNANQIKSSYEANSGISQDIDTFEVKYNYSTKINNHLFIAKCFHADLPNAERMIFRSKPFQLHKFDWVNEYLTLDFVPVAISNFQGKLFVFGTYKMAKINPEQFYIEEQIEGIGCLNDKMVVTTDAGMFWGDANYAYMWDGQKINKISLTISEKKDITGFTNYSWRGFISNSSALQCVASLKNRTILFINKSDQKAFVWDIEYQRWDFKLLPNQTINGVLTIPDGNVLLSTSSGGSPGVQSGGYTPGG